MPSSYDEIQNRITGLNTKHTELLEAVRSVNGASYAARTNGLMSDARSRELSLSQADQALASLTDMATGITGPDISLDFRCQSYVTKKAAGSEGHSMSELLSSSRGTTGSYWGPDGMLHMAEVDEPRFEHDRVTGEPLGILIEPSSENFAWPGMFGTIHHSREEVDVVSPASQIGAPTFKVTFAEEPSGAYAYDNVVDTTEGRYYTISSFFKAGTYTGEISLGVFGGAHRAVTSRTITRFNPSTGEIVYVSESAEQSRVEKLPDGWIWASATVKTDSEGALGATWYYTHGGESGEYFYATAPQVEEQKNATSYILTNGSRVSRDTDRIQVVESSLERLQGSGVTVTFEATQYAEVGSVFSVSGWDGSSFRVGLPTNNNRTVNGLVIPLWQSFPVSSIGTEVIGKVSLDTTDGYTQVILNGGYKSTLLPDPIYRISGFRLGALGGNNNNISGHIGSMNIYSRSVPDETSLRAMK